MVGRGGAGSRFDLEWRARPSSSLGRLAESRRVLVRGIEQERARARSARASSRSASDSGLGLVEERVDAALDAFAGHVGG